MKGKNKKYSACRRIEKETEFFDRLRKIEWPIKSITNIRINRMRDIILRWVY